MLSMSVRFGALGGCILEALPSLQLPVDGLPDKAEPNLLGTRCSSDAFRRHMGARQMIREREWLTSWQR